MAALVLPGGGPPVIPSYGVTSKCTSNNGLFCWGWVQKNWQPVLLPAFLQHVALVVMAVAIGFVISLVLAILTYRRGAWDVPFTALGGFFYAIPAIAAFEVLVPVTGLTTLTVEIVLVSYTLLVLYRSVLLGLRGVDPEVLESARGMGLADRQILTMIELPLAIPAIIAGLRVATVATVSLATIAAYVIPTGLGDPIFYAMGNGDFNTELVAAGVLVILLALVMDRALVIFKHYFVSWQSAGRRRQPRAFGPGARLLRPGASG
ncbi:MAG: ABC transporter permease [Pseudonocardiales bacterium]|nr:MAG: ABC transporter permease [Pseudonocardiales bacterium]